MKIEGHRPNLAENTALQKLDKALQDAKKPATEARKAVSGDRVELSSDSALASVAAKAAAVSPDVRLDLVERMRALIDAGEFGNDPERLADAIIDSLLEQK